MPEVRHVAFRWGDTIAFAARDELRATGFTVEDHWVMAATAVAPRTTSGFEIRPLRGDDLQLAADLGLAIADDHSEAYRQFLNRRATWKARLAERGLGQFWGAFDRGRLVGSLGLVSLGAIARYQDVQTAPTHRGRGIASALLAAAAAAVAVDRYIIVAEPDSGASRLYARAGFTVIERMVSAVIAPVSRSGS
jgi:GNAT superfamily N-acetyltransferase